MPALAPGARPPRRQSRRQPGAPVRLAAHQVDLHRSGLCRRMPARRRMAGRRPASRSASRRRCATRPATRWWSPITTATARMCCSTATTTCSRSTRSICGRPTRSRRRCATGDKGQKVISGARLGRRQGPADDLRRGLPRLEGRAWQAALQGDHPVRGRGGIRLALAEAVPARPMRRS